MNTELIQLKEVSKKFGKNVVLENLDLDIPEKQITGIIGASGMGKSTILKLIIGFYKPDKGKILYLKRNVLKDSKNIKQTFGFSTEDGSFYEDLTVRENLFHFGSLYNIKRKKIKEKTKELLDFVGLSDSSNTKAGNLSVGMKKRLDFACSLIHEPEVLILDEPTADLDPLLRKQILSMIVKVKKQGTTVVLTTQLLDEMDEICDKIAILHNKKIVENDTPQRIKSKYSTNDLNNVFEKVFSKKKDPEKKSNNKTKEKKEHKKILTGQKKQNESFQEKDNPEKQQETKQNIESENEKDENKQNLDEIIFGEKEGDQK